MYADSFKIVTNIKAKEHYVLAQCGAPVVGTDVVGELLNATRTRLGGGGPTWIVKEFSVPLAHVSSETTVVLAFLEMLHVHDRALFIPSWATGACYQRSLNNCAGVNVTRNGTIVTVDAPSIDTPDDSDILHHLPPAFESKWGGDHAGVRSAQIRLSRAVFVDAASSPESGASSEERAKQIVFSGAADPGPLHRAEWIKFVAAFFNLEGLANQLFDVTKEAYEQRSREVATTTKKRALFVSKQAANPAWGLAEMFLVHYTPYKQKLIEEAGGRVAIGKDALLKELNKTLFSLTNTTNNLPTVGWTDTYHQVEIRTTNGDTSLAAAVLWQSIGSLCDCLIDETYVPDPKTFNLKSWTELMHVEDGVFPFRRCVLREDGRLSRTLGMDWFETGIARPAVVQRDLVRAFAGNMDHM